jgi:hypothetical protein
MALADAPYHPDGLIARMVQKARKLANEPLMGDRVVTNSDITDMLDEALAVLIPDLYGVSDAAPHAQFQFTTVANQQYYRLPANVQEIKRVACLDSTTGMPKWVVHPNQPRSGRGPIIIFDGLTGLQLVPIPATGDDVLTVDYVPGGQVSFHQNASPLYTQTGDTGTLRFTSTTMKLHPRSDTGWLLGRFDRRPNAFIGNRLRILGTVNGVQPGASPASAWFPVQERHITSYALTDGGKITIAPAFDSSILDGSSTWANWQNADLVDLDPLATELRTYFIYEVVPDLDPALFTIAAGMAAHEILTQKPDERKAKSVMHWVESRKRALMQRWANYQQITGGSMDTSASDDEETSWML